MNIIVTEVLLKEGHRHNRVFRFPVDPKGGKTDTLGNPFDYRARVSTNCFFFSTNKRNYKRDEVLYHSAWEEDHKLLRFSTHAIDYIDVDSIWDFYTLIGYDYKKKKYL